MKTFVYSAYLNDTLPEVIDSNLGEHDEITSNMSFGDALDKFREVFIIKQDSGKTNYIYIDSIKKYLCVTYVKYSESEFNKLFARKNSFDEYEETVMRLIAAAFGDKYKVFADAICECYD